MPEVRHGSNLRAQSDPVLPHTATNGSTNSALHHTASVPSRPLQQSHTQSADHVPVTQNHSSTSRFNMLLRGRSNEETTNSSTTMANGGANRGIRITEPPDAALNNRRRNSLFPSIMPVDTAPRQSLSLSQRPTADVYYDSRAGSRKEWRRRAKTLEEYYEEHPDLLPQLPFSWHHGNRRWRLWLFAFFVFVDASAVPIALYYGLKYAGGVEPYIIFAVVTTIWGGPTYLEFGIRTLRLMKKEHFYRPLGTTSRWGGDITNWIGSLAIFVLTVLFIIGSAPRNTWLRVVAMAAPSILWTLGGSLLLLTLYHRFKWPAPFRISSTPKGGEVLPGAYYFIEDTLAVNARCGRPYREALMARYKASPRFREMLYEQSLFWSIPSLILATLLTIMAVLPPVPENWAYGVCWTAPFIWAFGWGCITIPWAKARMVRERLEWEAGKVPGKEVVSPVMSPVASPPVAATPVGFPPVSEVPV